MNREPILVLHGVEMGDLIRALRGSGLVVSNGAFPSLFAISRAPLRFPDASNVIDLAAEVPALLRRQAGPERDVRGVDYDVPDGAA